MVNDSKFHEVPEPEWKDNFECREKVFMSYAIWWDDI